MPDDTRWDAAWGAGAAGSAGSLAGGQAYCAGWQPYVGSEWTCRPPSPRSTISGNGVAGVAPQVSWAGRRNLKSGSSGIPPGLLHRSISGLIIILVPFFNQLIDIDKEVR